MRWPWTPRSTDVTQRFGFAVVGLGHGATKFLQALQGSPTMRVTALVSGDAAKAERLARAHRIPAVYHYDEFERIAQNREIDAVYLCLPNALHRDYTERAARAGKHVLCEKPMGATVDDCRQMIEACHATQRLLMIGYRPAFSSVHARAKNLLVSGLLGEVQTIRSGFGFRAKGGWRLDSALAGGGSLFDVGIYSVNALYTLFGEMFIVDAATVTRDPLSGIEMAVDWRGRLQNGATIHCESSYLAKTPDFFEVKTSRATLTLKPAFSYEGLRLEVRAHARANRRELNIDVGTPRQEPSAFRLEAEHLALCAQNGLPVASPGEHGLRDLETLTRIYQIASPRDNCRQQQETNADSLRE